MSVALVGPIFRICFIFKGPEKVPLVFYPQSKQMYVPYLQANQQSMAKNHKVDLKLKLVQSELHILQKGVQSFISLNKL